MSRTFWDRFAGFYDLAEWTNGKAVRGMAAEVARRLPEDAEFLECAAGTGELSLAAAPFVRRVICTDLSLPMLDRAQKKAGKRGISNIEFAQRDLLHLPEPDGTYSAVCAGNVLHLLDRPEDALTELWRVTAPGGVLLLPTFFMGEASPLMNILVALYRLLGFHQKHSFTRQSYQALFKRLNLPLTELTVIPGRIPVGLAVLQKPNIREG